MHRNCLTKNTLLRARQIKGWKRREDGKEDVSSSLDRNLWKTRFGRCCGSFVRQTTERKVGMVLFDPWQGQEIFVAFKVSRVALVPIQVAVHFALADISPGEKQRDC